MSETEFGKILIYQNEKGDTKIDVYFEGDTIWMSQKSLAELYRVRIPTINEHIRNILSDGELDESTIREFLIVQNEGGRQIERHIKHYNFQMVLATGYHVVILRAGTMTGFPVRNCRAFQSRRSTSRNVPNPAKRSGCPTRIFIMCFSTYKISITHNMAIDFAARLNILLLSYGHQVNRFLFTR